MRWMLVAVCVCLLPVGAAAAVVLPLDGYCKGGKFFPIRIDGSDAGHLNAFSADGCMALTVEAPAAGRTVAPMLVTGLARELRWAGGSVALREVGRDERLIGMTGDQTAAAAVADLFQGQRLLPIHLDPADLLPGPPVAWETLDAIVLDFSEYQRISDAERSALLAGGVMLVSVGEQVPDHRWPWKKAGSRWVLSRRMAGPTDELIDENIYAPTFAWRPGWSAAVRMRVVCVGVLLLMTTCALMLRPSRWTQRTAVGVALLATAGVIGWRQSLGSVDRVGGDVLVVDSGVVEDDAFVYERAKTLATQTVAWTGWTHPVFSSDAAFVRANMRMKVSADDRLSFIYESAAGHTMVFLRREVLLGEVEGVTAARGSPMEEAARLEYLRVNDRIAGEVPGGEARWAGVVVERNEPGRGR